MKIKQRFIWLSLLAPLALTSCDTPTGQGAAAGAGAGALIGGLATGRGRGAVIGAAAGAAAGALIGRAVQEDRAAQYGPPPPGGFPFARRADKRTATATGSQTANESAGAGAGRCALTRRGVT